MIPTRPRIVLPAEYVVRWPVLRTSRLYSKTFIILVVAAWLVSLTSLSELVEMAMATGPSIIIGIAVGALVMIFARGTQWLYALIYIVFLEQIFNMGASFIDETVIVFLTFKILISRRSPIKHETGRYIVAFVLVCFLSAALNGVPPAVFVAGVRSYIQYVLVFLFVFNSRMTEEDLNKLITTLIIVGLLFSAVGLVNVLTGRVSEAGRSEGVLSNANALAAYLALILPFLWFNRVEKGFLPWLKHLKLKWLGLITFLAFISTGSRAMIIGVGTGLMLVTFLKSGDFKQKLKLAAMILLLTGAGIIMTEGHILERFSQVASKEYLDPEANVRTYYSEQGWRILKDKPLLGVGPGRYGGSVSTIWDSPIYTEYGIRFPNEWAGVVQADVFYPHIFAEIGIVGALFFALLIARPVLIWIWRLLMKSLHWTPLAASLTASLVAIIVASMGGNYLVLHLTAIFYWTFLAVLILEMARQRTARAVANVDRTIEERGPTELVGGREVSRK